jgi:hypothetical protein
LIAIFSRQGTENCANPRYHCAQRHANQTSKRWLNVFVMKNRRKARGAYAGLALPAFARVFGFLQRKFLNRRNGTKVSK